MIKNIFLILLTMSDLFCAPVKTSYIEWGDNLHIKLDEKGFHTAEGLHVFGSFSLKDKDFRSIEIARSIHHPLHAYALAYSQYTVYILDLEHEKMIGSFNLPERGTPRFIKIEPDNNGQTTLRTVFTILPSPGTRGRPGPPIHQVMIYEDGKFLNNKRKSKPLKPDIEEEPAVPFNIVKKQSIQKAKSSEQALEQTFSELHRIIKKQFSAEDEEHNTHIGEILKAIEDEQHIWHYYRDSHCHSEAILNVFPVNSGLFIQEFHDCLHIMNVKRLKDIQERIHMYND